MLKHSPFSLPIIQPSFHIVGYQISVAGHDFEVSFSVWVSDLQYFSILPPPATSREFCCYSSSPCRSSPFLLPLRHQVSPQQIFSIPPPSAPSGESCLDRAELKIEFEDQYRKTAKQLLSPPPATAVAMGSKFSKQVERRKAIAAEKKALSDLLASAGDSFPCSDYRVADPSRWISDLGPPEKLRLSDIVWPGTHDSATDCIGFPLITRPFAQCQSLCISDQLAAGARVLDIRVRQDYRVCHGVLATYPVSLVLDQVTAFLDAHPSELLILEIRTEFGQEDPAAFDAFLIDRLAHRLIHQDDAFFSRTAADVLPKQIVCVWKPRKAAHPPPGGPLWSAGYLRDNWIDTDLPNTKFESNMKHLGGQPPTPGRKFFYRVENTVTPQADNPVLCVRPVTRRIQPYARLFISQAFARGIGDRLQLFSTDFINADFVNACAGVTLARMQGKD